MNEQLIKFIELCLIDGVISDKEREVIFRKSKELGVPEDECEIILEGMTQQKNLENNRVEPSLKNHDELEETEVSFKDLDLGFMFNNLNSSLSLIESLNEYSSILKKKSLELEKYDKQINEIINLRDISIPSYIEFTYWGYDKNKGGLYYEFPEVKEELLMLTFYKPTIIKSKNEGLFCSVFMLRILGRVYLLLFKIINDTHIERRLVFSQNGGLEVPEGYYDDTSDNYYGGFDKLDKRRVKFYQNFNKTTNVNLEKFEERDWFEGMKNSWEKNDSYKEYKKDSIIQTLNDLKTKQKTEFILKCSPSDLNLCFKLLNNLKEEKKYLL